MGCRKRSTSLVRVDAQSSLSDSNSDEFMLEGEEVVANVQTNEPTLGEILWKKTLNHTLTGMVMDQCGF